MSGDVCDAAVRRFMDRLAREDVMMHGFTLDEGGEPRAEVSYAPFTLDAPHRMYSISKSVVSLAIGLLVTDGRLDTGARAADFFKDLLPTKPDARVMRLTVRDMLRMATCHRATTYKEGADDDWTATFFSKVPTHEPGTVFNYDTSCAQTLGALCERVSGRPLLDFLNERLFKPIGATGEKRWLCDPSGAPQGGTGLIMSLRDLRRLALLVADGGRGLISAEYIAAATSKQIDTPFCANPEERYGYGYQFWRTRDGWAMYGMGGQLAVYSPARRLLLCTTADTRLDPYGVQRIYDAFFNEIVNAGDGVERGANGVFTLSEPSVRALENKPAYAFAFAGSYDMLPNEMGLTALRFESGSVTLLRGEREHVLRYRLGEAAESVISGERCIVSAGFCAPRTLRLRCNFIGDAPCGMDILIAASGDAVTVRSRRSNDPLTEGYDGCASGEGRWEALPPKPTAKGLCPLESHNGVALRPHERVKGEALVGVIGAEAPIVNNPSPSDLAIPARTRPYTACNTCRARQ